MPQTMAGGAHFALNGLWSTSKPIVTTFHAQVVTSGSRAAGLDQACMVLMNHWVANVVPTLPNNYTLATGTWMDLDSASGPTGIHTRAVATGGVSGQSVPPSIGPVMRRVISGSGRAHRSGRLFLPGLVSTSDVDENGAIQSVKKTALNTAFAAFLTAIAGQAALSNFTSMQLVVAHVPSIVRTRSVTERVPDPDGALGWSAITEFACKDYASGIKRRVGV